MSQNDRKIPVSRSKGKCIMCREKTEHSNLLCRKCIVRYHQLKDRCRNRIRKNEFCIAINFRAYYLELDNKKIINNLGLKTIDTPKLLLGWIYKLERDVDDLRGELERGKK